MTTYYMNSGGILSGPDRGRQFFLDLLSGAGKRPSLLIGAFSQPQERWAERFVQYYGEITAAVAPDLEPDFHLADPENIAAQVAAADALYFPGGDDHLVQDWFTRLNLPELWQGKKIGTNSASSMAIAQSAWGCDERTCRLGLGLVPIRFIPHYQSNYGSTDPRGPINWDTAYHELEQYGDPALPIWALKEGEYRVVEQ